ncbi:MAG: metal ABC transporter permease [bacterium]|nr:metal ABC transporter permease [bacterium]
MNWTEATLRFFSFQDINVQTVVIGSILLGGLNGLVGAFSVLKKRALIGDTIGHAALPGIALAFLLTHGKSTISLLLGAIVTGLAAVWVVSKLQNIPKIKQDAALGLTLTVAFGIGVLLLSHIQRSNTGNQSGLDKFLFGQSANLVTTDVVQIGILTILVIATVILFYKEFSLIAFDRNFAHSIGWNAHRIDMGLLLLTTLTIAISLQAVGVVLTSAILIIPSAAARFWTDRLSNLLGLASLFGMISGLTGTYISFMVKNMPSGPLIVLSAFGLFLVSILFAPKKGILAKVFRKAQNQKNMACEHLLRACWEINENQTNPIRQNIPFKNLQMQRTWQKGELSKAIKVANKKGLITLSKDGVQLTPKGVQLSKKVVQLHRLWEKYLIQTAQFKATHIETESDLMEHYLPEHVQTELEKENVEDVVPASPHPIIPKQPSV